MPPTIHELEASYLARLEAAQRRRAAAQAGLQSIVTTARARPGRLLTAAEDAHAAAYARDLEAARSEVSELDNHLAQCRTAVIDEQRIIAAQSVSHPTSARKPAYDRVMRVGRESRTYSPDTDRRGTNFLLDLARGQVFGDPQANERLARHSREEEVERGSQLAERASTTANFSGIVAPAYLVDMFGEAISSGRPFADSLTPHDLPPTGMTVNFGRLSTPSAVTLQANQNDAIGNADLDDTLLTENVQTAAGYTVVSRQAVDRGVFTDETVMSELMRRSAVTLDSTLINQASTGAIALATAGTTAYTTTQPTAAGLYPKLYAALNVVESALLDVAPPDTLCLAPRRFKWLCSQVGSTFPTFGSALMPAQMTGMILNSEYGSAVRAVLNDGTKIVVDGAIPINRGVGTNEDICLAYASREMHLFEDASAPFLLRAEQYAAPNLGILYTCWSYFAYSFRRYDNAVASVSGTGLVSPVFA